MPGMNPYTGEGRREISMLEIERMSRDAYERGKREERKHWRPLLERLLKAFQGDWPEILVAVADCRWCWLPVDDEVRDAVMAARKAVHRAREDSHAKSST